MSTRRVSRVNVAPCTLRCPLGEIAHTRSGTAEVLFTCLIRKSILDSSSCTHRQHGLLIDLGRGHNIMGHLAKFLAGLMLLTSAVSASARPLLGDQAAIRAEIERRVAETGVPGAAWVAVENGRVLYSDATGVASRRTGAPLTTATPMEIGSLTKTFTAAAVMMLVEDGRVRLDAPVRTYLPWFRLADESIAARITVRHLLSHTSGLHRRTSDRMLRDLGMDAGAMERHAKALATVLPTAAPGTVHQYANANFLLLGVLVETVAKQPYARFVEERILRPLQMDDTYVVDAPAGVRPAAGHRPWIGRFKPNDRPQLGRSAASAGFIVSSVRDLGKYLVVMAAPDDRLLKAATKQAMMQPQPGSPLYGLGWMLAEGEHPKVAWHGGATLGFFTAASIEPGGGRAFAIITNQSRGALATADDLGRGVSNVAWGEPLLVPHDASVAKRWASGFVLIIALAVGYAALVIARRRKSQTSRRKSLIIAGLLGLAAVVVAFGPTLAEADYWSTWRVQPELALLGSAAAAALLAAALVRVWVRKPASPAPFPSAA